MSTDAYEPGSSFDPPSTVDLEGQAETGVFGALTRLSSHKARETNFLRRLGREPGLQLASSFLRETLSGPDLVVGAPELFWRVSGLRRAGVVAQIIWPRLSTRFGIGLETTIAHAVVDRLLGFERQEAESRLQVSPVEWGILTFLVARGFESLVERPGPLGPWDVWIDRVGPDSFDTSGLARVVTLRWPIRIGTVAGSLRLWLPGPLIDQWVDAGPNVWPTPAPPDARQADWETTWIAEAGTVALPRGLQTLRVGGVLPFFRSNLRGTPRNPQGPVELALTLADGVTCRWPATPAPDSAGSRLTLTAAWRSEPPEREPPTVSQAIPHPNDRVPTDLPVTLVIELGRVNLPLSRVADLQPGDVLDLQRHSREPVELTSGGRAVARGELVQIDDELGVRVTHVYL
ncbi:MAG: FliM/FliN family flagellar motor switch protein [Isosphaeraceae bacterium]